MKNNDQRKWQTGNTSLLQRYRSMPEPLRLVATAVIGAAIGYVTYLLIYIINPIQPRATSSWLIAFIINVLRQHGLHRHLTFENPGPYWPSLGRAYLMYVGSAIATTALNWYLSVHLAWNHNLAWLVCISLTAAISLVFLKRFVFFTKYK